MKKRLLSLILALCIIISFSPSTLAANLPEVDVRTEGLTPAQPQEAPAEKPRDAGAERRTIYVSNEGTEEDDGATAETPTTLARATELANEGKKPVEIVVLGQVSVDTWTSPTVETTLRGGDENAELLFEYCSASDGAYNISLADALTIDEIKFNCNYTDYFFSRYYGTYTIVANGYPLVIASGVQYSYYTADTIVDGKTCSTSSCYVIGGGLDEDITGGTHVEIYTSLPLTYVYGGGVNGSVESNVYLHIENCGKIQHVRAGGYANKKDAKVNGNITLDFINSVTDNPIYGGGYARSSYSAEVTGSICINLSGLNNGFGRPIYGGGYGKNAPVVGNITFNISNTKMNNNAAAIYGGGYDSDVTGDIFIHIKENSLISEETVWGGGTGDSTITGGVTITVDDSSEVIGEIRAGGNEGADVIGDVVITVSGGPQSACPTIFATGKGEDEDNPAQVDGNVSITLHGSRANVYTLDKFGEVTSDHTVTIILDDTDELSGAVRGDSKLDQHLYNHEKNTPTRTGNGASVIVKGDYTSTGIHGFPEVVIEDGGILREHLASGETLFDGVETVTIQEGGALDLLQSNEISGNFTCAGTLKMPAPISAEADICYLTAGGNVTVQEGAAYVPTKDNGAAEADYVKGDVFLKQKAEYLKPSQKVKFVVSDAGNEAGYFTSDRQLTDENITHEWYVDLTEYVTIRPADITIYTGGGSYEGVVDGSGKPSTDNGMPEAGFRFTIPDSVNSAMGGTGEAADLSQYLTFTYSDGAASRKWTIKPYSEGATSTTDLGDGIARFVYQMVPAEGQDAVRLQFTDPDTDEVKISDDFVVTADQLNRTYEMSIYSGGLNQGKVMAEFKDVPGLSSTLTYPVNIEPGVLTIRGVTQESTAPVATEDAQVNQDAITAVAPADVTYYVNDSQVEITDKNAVHLLTDEVLDDQVLIDHISNKIIGSDTGIPNGDYLYEFQYLDLVDSSNGNAYVTLGDGQTIDLYWPVPDDADTSAPFYIVHFDALDRDYEGAADEQLKENPTEKLDGTLVTLNGKQYIKFATGSFSPFALVYQKESGGGDHGGGGGTTYYTLRYESNGGTKYKDERYRRNTLVELDKEPVREGYTFTGWYADKALTEPIDDIRMTSNKTVYAGWERTGVPDRLNGDDHFAYIIGRDDGLVHPEAPITRAEVATIFFRLLTDEARDEYLTETSPFADVASDAWYATAVATMQAMGIVEGRSPSAFDPEAPITRGEFAAIAARFDSDPYHGDDRFTDISGHWAAEYINQAAVKGWVEGQPDGSFAPDRSISRAEAMTLVNRVLGRLPETADDLLDGMITWPDNPPDAWYYLAVQEATNSHDYDRKADTVHETWTGLQPAGNWAQYQ